MQISTDQMSRILFIRVDASLTSPHGIRDYEIMSRVCNDNEVSCLTFSRPFPIDSARVSLSTAVSGGGALILNLALRIIRRASFPDEYVFVIGFYKRRMKSLMQKTNFTHFVICVTPFSLLMLASWVKKLSPTSTIVTDMSDPFSFNMNYVHNRLKRTIAQYFENRWMTAFDVVVCLNYSIKMVYEDAIPHLSGKIFVVEQGIDFEFISCIKNCCMRNKKNAGSEISYLYAGVFYVKGRNPKHLFSAFKNSNNSELTVYGNFSTKINKLAGRFVKINRAIERAKLAQVIAGADVLVMVDNEFGYQVPGKTLEMLASGKPLVFIYTNEFSPTHYYVDKATNVIKAKNDTNEILSLVNGIKRNELTPAILDTAEYHWDNLIEYWAEITRVDTIGSKNSND